MRRLVYRPPVRHRRGLQALRGELQGPNLADGDSPWSILFCGFEASKRAILPSASLAPTPFR